MKAAGVGFALGCGLEIFMVSTGFYGVATRKEAERRVEQTAELRSVRSRRRSWKDMKPSAGNGTQAIDASSSSRAEH